MLPYKVKPLHDWVKYFIVETLFLLVGCSFPSCAMCAPELHEASCTASAHLIPCFTTGREKPKVCYNKLITCYIILAVCLFLSILAVYVLVTTPSASQYHLQSQYLSLQVHRHQWSDSFCLNHNKRCRPKSVNWRQWHTMIPQHILTRRCSSGICTSPHMVATHENWHRRVGGSLKM